MYMRLRALKEVRVKIEIEISEEDYTVIKDHCEKYGMTLYGFFQQFADDAIGEAVSAIQGLEPDAS